MVLFRQSKVFHVFKRSSTPGHLSMVSSTLDLALERVYCTSGGGAVLASGYLVDLLSFTLTVITYSWPIMSDGESKVPEELFKDVKFYVGGDIDEKVRLWTIAHSFLPSMLTS